CRQAEMRTTRQILPSADASRLRRPARLLPAHTFVRALPLSRRLTQKRRDSGDSHTGRRCKGPCPQPARGGAPLPGRPKPIAQVGRQSISCSDASRPTIGEKLRQVATQIAPTRAEDG